MRASCTILLIQILEATIHVFYIDYLLSEYLISLLSYYIWRDWTHDVNNTLKQYFIPLSIPEKEVRRLSRAFEDTESSCTLLQDRVKYFRDDHYTSRVEGNGTRTYSQTLRLSLSIEKQLIVTASYLFSFLLRPSTLLDK